MDKETYTEISEKKTSKLGYLLLIALFIFLIIIGQTVFSDISKIPERPVGPSYCVNGYLGKLESLQRKQTCRFNEFDKEFGLDDLVNELDPEIDIIIGYNTQISRKNSQISSNERQINSLLQRYGLSLQEVIAGEEDPLLDKPEIKNQVISLRSNNENLRAELSELTSKRDAAIQNTASKHDTLKNTYAQAQETYKTRLAYYNLKVFLLKLLFVLPFFGVSLYYYLRYKKKDSPYTIIITSIFYASTILFLQTALAFLYQILPKTWLSRIFETLMSVPLLRYILYYGVTALVIIVLGGIVYYIQKKIYDPKRVALRHLKENKCPNCSFNLSLSDVFCPNCGRRIKTKCSNCENLRYTDLMHCPFCGKK